MTFLHEKTTAFIYSYIQYWIYLVVFHVLNIKIHVYFNIFQKKHIIHFFLILVFFIWLIKLFFYKFFKKK